MGKLEEILEYNKKFVENQRYTEFTTTKFPDKRLVVISCMDTRLVELLPHAMNVKNGDVKIIKTAGAIVSHPFGAVMRSILVAIYELQAEEVIVVGHYDCGMSAINPTHFLEKVRERGVSADSLHLLKSAGINLEKWLRGFDNVTDAVKESVDMILNHPLLPPSVPIHGLIIDPSTGKLDVVINGYEKK
ncbi:MULTISPECIES: beta-class carbonic anhydrase [Brevibacillus]|uniref:beta-class carbonic anhydrase n=1 Tax=Brevibacillus TaxID=55080 RepID=UPI0002405084|nr:carbonic anhydrase [Brevibacillus laterosporus]MCZ0837009.1 carbonic anhydrase [Brevibacillus halotolerans]AUM63393.1 carbonic anhydrase [Brevibacillus laterosporus]MCR8964854.1 carbonic anhydrase [Brevibacillus laterosporus]MDN9011358.1 carbonic anhydrase [Brevibacillus laterosporus]MDO0942464.1 carbonic anhydrase [Brevibacillus laterosporus]